MLNNIIINKSGRGIFLNHYFFIIVQGYPGAKEVSTFIQLTMAKQWSCRSKLAKKNQHLTRAKTMWNEKLQEFDAVELGNEKGRTRTFRENKIFL